MRPIPKKHRDRINNEEYFKKSCLSGEYPTIRNRIVIHHAWQYAGRQVNEMWNYCPLLESEHNYASKEKSVHNDEETNMEVKLIAIRRAGLGYLKKAFPKKNWEQETKNIYYKLKKL